MEYHGRFQPLTGNFVLQDANIFINEIEEMEDGTSYAILVII